MTRAHATVDAAARLVRYEYLLAPFLLLTPVLVALALVLASRATGDARAATFGIILLAGTGVVNARMVRAFVKAWRRK